MKHPLFIAILLLWLTLPAAPAASDPPPSLLLSVNGQSAAEAYRGWPILVRVEIFSESLMQNPGSTNVQIISSGSNGWGSSLHLEVADSTGATIPVLPLPANAPTGALTLTSDLGGESGWWLSPQVTSNLTAGTYTLQAVLITTNSTEGWRGVARSRKTTVRIADQPASPSPAFLAEQFLRGADYAVWRDDLDQANQLLDELLAAQPANGAALSRKGDLLAFRGLNREALEFYQFALQVCFARHTHADAEPPQALLKRHRDAMSKLAFTPHLYLTVNRDLQGRPVLRWLAEPGKAYAVESTADLKNWRVDATGLVAETNRLTWTTNNGGAVRFYRVTTSND